MGFGIDILSIKSRGSEITYSYAATRFCELFNISNRNQKKERILMEWKHGALLFYFFDGDYNERKTSWLQI